MSNSSSSYDYESYVKSHKIKLRKSFLNFYQTFIS